MSSGEFWKEVGIVALGFLPPANDVAGLLGMKLY